MHLILQKLLLSVKGFEVLMSDRGSPLLNGLTVSLRVDLKRPERETAIWQKEGLGMKTHTVLFNASLAVCLYIYFTRES
jgi:hypothetical protein